MTTILKGYYLKVTLENRIVKHNGRKVYLSIVEHGNGIPDNALILKINATCAKFSVCLSIRSQCGWKELDQNESGELTFDLKVEVTGKSQRAPLFPLVFQLCEKNHDQVSLISKSVIPVKAITKIPKKSLRAELVPLGEQPTKPPQTYPANGSGSGSPEPEEVEQNDLVMEDDEEEETDSASSSDSSSPRLQSSSANKQLLVASPPAGSLSTSITGLVSSFHIGQSPSSSTSVSPSNSSTSLVLPPLSLNNSNGNTSNTASSANSSNNSSPSALKKSKSCAPNQSTGPKLSISTSSNGLLTAAATSAAEPQVERPSSAGIPTNPPSRAISKSNNESSASQPVHAHEDSLAFLSALAAMKSSSSPTPSSPTTTTPNTSASSSPTPSSLSSILCQPNENDNELLPTPPSPSSQQQIQRRSLSPNKKQPITLTQSNNNTNNTISNISTSINHFYSQHVFPPSPQQQHQLQQQQQQQKLKIQLQQQQQSSPISSPTQTTNFSPRSCTFNTINNINNNNNNNNNNNSIYKMISPQQPSLTSVPPTIKPSPLVLSVPTNTLIVPTVAMNNNNSSSSSAYNTPKMASLAPLFGTNLLTMNHHNNNNNHHHHNHHLNHFQHHHHPHHNSSQLQNLMNPIGNGTCSSEQFNLFSHNNKRKLEDEM
ncbi:hypothetical protein DFA_03793 [Cavenderia fasciculata]|uniref:Uncharacterized protein n=1 Tax=Cavenderia fasciculata TaxID=261658 RepID=F4Q0E8_CACFS|nr:uncharacterized protein DFA_03793 [Cavenderia fasciculata]EGG18299.1 hypothetical protein DFA_03793 [Cavenderia fasciculata]|eukprot:XP_004357122.1 hypothetical protein DFA_03793 [Cavenderia fasciculata]